MFARRAREHQSACLGSRAESIPQNSSRGRNGAPEQVMRSDTARFAYHDDSKDAGGFYAASGRWQPPTESIDMSFQV
jgi:hypothetical protein